MRKGRGKVRVEVGIMLPSTNTVMSGDIELRDKEGRRNREHIIHVPPEVRREAKNII